MKTIIAITGILILALGLPTNAQSGKIKGQVTDTDNIPLPGVSIQIEHTTKGTVSDMDGFFIIETDSTECNLIFSCVGYLTENIHVSSEIADLHVTLTEDIVELDEVMVIGYGTVTKSDMTGAVSAVSFSASGRAAGISIRGSRSSRKASRAIVNFGMTGGMLTAGEVNDFSKWELWKDISANDLNLYQRTWNMNPVDRYTVQVKTSSNLPVIGAAVKMKDDAGELIWTARTDNTGKAELWNKPFDSSRSEKKLSADVECNGSTYTIPELKGFHDGINNIEIKGEYSMPENADIVFVVDATSSMSDEISYLKAELMDIMIGVRNTLKDNELSLGAVFYRDYGDAYITIKSDLSKDISECVRFVKNNDANGGGDYPEAVHEALNTAINDLSWNERALTRIIFLILDAPPHDENKIISRMAALSQTAAEKGIRIVPVTCSGVDKSTEYLMRCMALLTNGTYTFLTDDSGIGNAHIKPTTDKYDVELFNELIMRIIYQYTHVPEPNVHIQADNRDTLIVTRPVTMTDTSDSSIVEEKSSRKTERLNLKEEQMGWKYYPNPTDGLISIETEIESGEFYLCDLSGKILHRHIIESRSQFSIDISSYPSGIYFITYEYDKDKWMKGKVVLVH